MTDKLIAEFMGYEYYGFNNPNHRCIDYKCGYWGKKDSKLHSIKIEGSVMHTLLRYSSSWNHLMPVVEKIESIHDDFHGYFGVHISSNNCSIQGTNLRTDPENYHPAYFSDYTLDTKLLSTYRAVVEFIKWYKEKIQTKKEESSTPIA